MTTATTTKATKGTNGTASARPHRWTAAEIADNMAWSDAWLLRGLLAIYARQSDAERAAGRHLGHDGKGFTEHDAALLSSMARQVEGWRRSPSRQRREQGPLSLRQLAVVRGRMHKYAGQLARVANGE